MGISSKDEAIDILSNYQKEIKKILKRFNKSKRLIWIHESDDSKYRQFIQEIKDYLLDIFGYNDYSREIQLIFNEGIANFTRSPSYSSVERIIEIIGAVITRIERNPNILIIGKKVGKRMEIRLYQTKLL